MDNRSKKEKRTVKKLPGLLQEIIDGLETVEIVPVEVPEAEEGEHVVGTLPEELQRLCCLWRKMSADYATHTEVAKKELDGIDSISARGEAEERLNASLTLENTKCDTVMKIFWTTVRTHFPELAGKKHIGLGPDFQVYWEEGEEEGCNCPVCRAKREGIEIAPGVSVIGPFVLIPGGFETDEMQDEEPKSEDETPKEGAETEEDAEAVEGDQK